MAKLLTKEKCALVQEYAHYIAEQASLEQAILAASLSRDMHAVVDLIEKAKASARHAFTAARCLGLSPDYIPSQIIERAK